MGIFDGKLKVEYELALEKINVLEKEKDLLKISNDDLEAKVRDAREETDKLKTLLTNDVGQIVDAKEIVQNLVKKQNKLVEDIEAKTVTMETIDRKLKEKEEEYIVLDELVLLQSFGIYENQYDYNTSEEYKVKLNEIIHVQKNMIKDKTAAVSLKKWALEGSVSKGKKFIDDNIKQVIKTFNIECDNAIKKVRFNNFEMSKKRIVKSFKSLNKLNSLNYIEISKKYLDSKLEQLALEFEKARKKQEEKEELRRQRELKREELRVAKELEERRIEIEKEKEHYSNALIKLQDQIKDENDEDRRVILKGRLQDYQRNLDRIQVSLEEIDYREANKRAGYVYIISNIGAFGEGIYKIGMTRRLEPQDRVNELGGASVPFRFDVHGMIFSDDAPSLESALHREFEDKKVNMMNWRKEYFRVSLDEIEKVVNQNHDETVKLNRAHTAEQYRETIALLSNPNKQI